MTQDRVTRCTPENLRSIAVLVLFVVRPSISRPQVRFQNSVWVSWLSRNFYLGFTCSLSVSWHLKTTLQISWKLYSLDYLLTISCLLAATLVHKSRPAVLQTEKAGGNQKSLQQTDEDANGTQKPARTRLQTSNAISKFTLITLTCHGSLSLSQFISWRIKITIQSNQVNHNRKLDFVVYQPCFFGWFWFWVTETGAKNS